MKKLLLSLALLGSLGLAGCISAPVIPPLGIAYSDIKAPLSIGYNDTAVSSKSGVSESMSVLGLVAIGDASAKAAASANGIKTITHADYEFFNVLGVYQRYRTVVYGN